MDQFQKVMYEWTVLDKQLKQLHQQSNNTRKKKEALQKQLCSYIQDNELEDNIFSIPSLHSNISFKQHTTTESMSYKFLEEKFNSYFKTQEEAQLLLQYIKQNRKKDISYVLKNNEIKSDEI
jgi:hypothetical protein